ncbi:MAG: CoB--CoM heterodisulfide reductase iron-sulfur subunit A family protein [Chloroflexi bacterium]|nr:CoB--CoM heterodisulfide reductase iron-sulfur subunit A family protein [Chloroflexota bacterium]
MPRIGVFVCHCGANIAGTVDVERVVQEVQAHPDVVYAAHYTYMCSDPGQTLIRETIVREGLDGVVVAACSPSMHEATFRRASRDGGLNAYRCEIANIREQVSWVHQGQPEAATRKAVEVVWTMIEKARQDEALIPLELPVVKRALVIGGGVAGLSAALGIAHAGFPVVLVEREAHLGGRLRELASLYLDGRADPLAPRLAAVEVHPQITVLTQAEVASLGGYVGNFHALVRQGNQTVEIDAGAVVVATGFSLYPQQAMGEYGGGEIADVVDALQFERMLAAGALRRPSDGRTPRSVVWVQCAGSRDPELHKPYCSKICCMYVAKQALAYRQRVPDGQAVVFYIDIRSGGKGYEEYVQTAMEEGRALYLRGKVSRLFPAQGGVAVWGVDTLSGKPLEVLADLVVLASAAVPREGAAELARTLRVGVDEHGFFSEAHPKLRPVESLTAGVFLAGAAQAPKDIPEATAQAGGAAAKVIALFSQRRLVMEPTVAYVERDLCSGCGLCVPACPYEARAVHPALPVATVNEALCQGCGACVVACPNKASRLRNYTPDQVLAMLEPYLTRE